MKTVYIASILLWWLSFLFGKTHAQNVQTFCTPYINGDIEISPAGHLWGISNHYSDTPDHESGFQQLDMNAVTLQYITYPNKCLKHIAVSPHYLYITEPDSNRIYVYSHTGYELDVIQTVDNPSNLFTDADDNIYVVETDLKKISKISPQGQKTPLVADPMLNYAYSLTGDSEGNLYTANRYTGQIYRYEKASGSIYPFSRIPSGTLSEDGSQISEMVFSNGKLYVASIGLSVIYVINELGEISLLAGSPGIRADIDDIGNRARFMNPIGLAASFTGDTIFVSDNGKIKTITNLGNAGVDENITAKNLNVFPNPSTDFIHIEINNQLSGEINWRLIDSDGKTVENGKSFVSESPLYLSFGNKACGRYYLILNDSQKIISTRALFLCTK